MKNILQNLLIFFALCLCALIAFQWVRETGLRRDIQKLYDTVHDKSEAILKLEAQVRLNNDEIKRLDGIRNQLTQIVKSNDVEIATLSKDLQKANFENERNRRQIEVYTNALQTANDNIRKQNEDIKLLSSEVKTLARERNLAVSN